MSRKIVSFVLFSIVFLSLSACVHPTLPPSPQKYVSYYKHEFTNPNSPYSVSSDDTILVEYLITNMNSAPIRLGLAVFADGIAQKYSTQDTDEKLEYIHDFDFEASTSKNITIAFSPEIPAAKNSFDLMITTLESPIVIAAGSDASVYDTAYVTIPQNIIHVNVGHLVGNNPFEKQTSYHQVQATDLLLAQVFNTSERAQFRAELFQPTLNQKSNGNLLHLKESDDLWFTFNMMGNIASKYRVTFLLNNKPIRFNKNCDYLDVNVSDGIISTCNINIDRALLSEENILLAVCVPVEESAFEENLFLINTPPKSIFLK